MWVEILNRSFEDNIVVRKTKPLGFLVIEPENLKFHYAQSTKRNNKTKKKEDCSKWKKKTTCWFP